MAGSSSAVTVGKAFDGQVEIEFRLRPLRPHAGVARRHDPVEGVDLNYVVMQPAEIFWRMLQFQEFDASEMSLSNYTSTGSTGPPFVAIPVFPSRVFRHGYFFINTTKGIEKGADLKGKRGGVPEYSMTAAVYMRGLMQHEFGVKPSDVEWVQGRTDRLGRALPPDVRLTQAPPGTELGDLLERGEIDFMMTANNPLSFRRGSPKVRRLFPDYAAMEKDYFKRTRIYPIMHTVVIRTRRLRPRSLGGAQSLHRALPRQGACYTCSPRPARPRRRSPGCSR
jgi:4,5-dihydroxyphthalate decarboxylase